MGASGDIKRINSVDESNLRRLNMSVTALQRLLTRQSETGAASRNQIALIDAAIAAGRNEARLVRAQLEEIHFSSSTSVKPIVQFLGKTVAELELLLDHLERALERLRG